MSHSSREASSGPTPATARLIDVIPKDELIASSLDELDAKYLANGNRRFEVWYEYLVPDELDLIFPTTDAKLNYLSFTRRLASAVHRGLAASAADEGASSTTATASRSACEHADALRGRSERFASVIDRFLDLHQILREA